MKKKLKVKKAFSGKMMRAAPAQGRRVIPVKQPRPGVRPGVQPLPSPIIDRKQQPAPGGFGGPLADIQFGVQPLPAAPNFGQPGPIPFKQAAPGGLGGQINPGMEQPAPTGLAEYALRYKNAPGGLGGQVNTGMQQPAPGGMAQPLPTAPSFGGPQPQGGDRFVNMFRQQAAPVQPVPAMKKGGIVRGGRAETKGTRPAKLY